MDRNSRRPTRPFDRINSIFHLYDPPVWLVSAAADGGRGGCIATFVVRASIVAALPRMVVGIAKHHFTWRLIEASNAFALHLLRADDLEAVWRFGLQSGHDLDKLADVATATTALGSPIYPDATAWLDCRVEDRFDIGDRTVYLTEVTDADILFEGPTLGVQTLLRNAPAARRNELDRLYRTDQAIDREAILAWRRKHRDGNG